MTMSAGKAQKQTRRKVIFRIAKRLRQLQPESMKKAIFIIFALVVIAIAVVLFQLGSIASSVVKDSINKYGPEMTSTAVSVESVSIKPYIGSATIDNLLVGNPEGYKAPNAFTLKEITVSLSPTSLLSDTVKVNTIEIHEPIFVYESNLLSSNISKLMDNIKANTKSTDKAAEKETESSGDGKQRQFVINRLLVTDGQVQVGVLGQSATVKLPKIELENFSPEGITAAQASNEILNAVLSRVLTAATEMAANAATDPAGAAAGLTEGALNSAGDVGKEVSGAIGGLFGGKKEESDK